MKKLFIVVLLLFSIINYGQASKVRFEYDASGNQIKRIWCVNCASRNSSDVKDNSKIESSDLQKFFPDDVISFYPNPVKEELYIKWELIDSINVNTIEVYTIEGKLLQTIVNKTTLYNAVISFKEFPKGMYIINLNYTNGNQKSIKIVKD